MRAKASLASVVVMACISSLFDVFSFCGFGGPCMVVRLNLMRVAVFVVIVSHWWRFVLSCVVNHWVCVLLCGLLTVGGNGLCVFLYVLVVSIWMSCLCNAGCRLSSVILRSSCWCWCWDCLSSERLVNLSMRWPIYLFVMVWLMGCV